MKASATRSIWGHRSVMLDASGMTAVAWRHRHCWRLVCDTVRPKRAAKRLRDPQGVQCNDDDVQVCLLGNGSWSCGPYGKRAAASAQSGFLGRQRCANRLDASRGGRMAGPRRIAGGGRWPEQQRVALFVGFGARRVVSVSVCRAARGERWRMYDYRARVCQSRPATVRGVAVLRPCVPDAESCSQDGRSFGTMAHEREGPVPVGGATARIARAYAGG